MRWQAKTPVVKDSDPVLPPVIDFVETGKFGATMSMEAGVIAQAKDVYMRNLLSLLNSVELPDFYDGDNYVKGNHFTVYEEASNVEIEWRPEEQGARLIMHNLKAVFYSDEFNYQPIHSNNRFLKRFNQLAVKGKGNCMLNEVNMEMGIRFKTQTLDDGRTVPAIETYNNTAVINYSEIEMKIEGGDLAELADHFTKFFNSRIADMIHDACMYYLEVKFRDWLNEQISDRHGIAENVSNEKLDWSTEEVANITPNAFELGIKGLFFD
jgi:hypothetical protein